MRRCTVSCNISRGIDLDTIADPELEQICDRRPSTDLRDSESAHDLIRTAVQFDIKDRVA